MRGTTNIGATGGVAGTDRGSEPIRSAFRSLERPDSRKKKFRRAATDICTSRRAIESTAAVISAYALLRVAGEARLHLLFAAKIAAASVTGSASEVQAAVAALIQEREAAMRAFAAEISAAERSHLARLRLARRSMRHRRFVPRPDQASSLDPSGAVRPVRGRTGRTRRSARPARSRPIRSAVVRGLDWPSI